MSVLLDSDVVIEVLRSRDLPVMEQWHSLADSGEAILFSPVTAAEIWAGLRAEERQPTAQLFNFLTCVQADYSTGELAGQLLLRFSKSHGLKIADALIAASAIQHKAALWTRNRKHYPMLELNFYN
jgi:predicted nucleic acid-binding protein